MKLSENWLREWANPDFDVQLIAEKLTQAGLEVDSVSPVAGDFSGVLVGQVKSVAPHPDADKLRVCEVDVAGDALLHIVCGASNVREGLKIPVAVVGAVLPGDFKIKKAKLRGEPSFGMLCSAKELGLAESSEGLLELPEDAPVGNDIRDYLALNDFTIEVDLTPNRSDCLGVAGIARELGVISRTNLTPVTINEVPATIQTTFPVSVEAKQACPNYIGRVIENINPKAKTPLWMQEKLRRSGLRSLSAVVDITNYVMLELGQPMHAFDLQKLQQAITVRYAKTNEKLTLLDGQEVDIAEQTLVIADASGPLALAGIMGGDASAVGSATASLFLEAAFFAPDAIAGQARSYGLHTDSSHRFERGVDPQLAELAMQRATSLILEIAGGQAGPLTVVSEESALPETPQILLRANRIKRVLGIELEAAEVEEQLTRLGLEVTQVRDGWLVIVPSFRFDINIEVDLIEELGRLYGYDRLPQTRPAISVLPSAISEKQLATERLQSLLVDRGYYEAITYSFVDPTLQKHFADSEADPIKLANPISADLSVMRHSLWPGLVQAMVYNLNRQHDRIRLFEVGSVFRGELADIDQYQCIGGLIYGDVNPEQWADKSRKVDFFDVKADVEALLAIGDGQVEFRAEAHPALHPGQSARIYQNGQAVGWIGALHPKLNKPLGFGGKAYVFELELAVCLQSAIPKFTALSRYPAIRRDLALVVDNSVVAFEIEHCLKGIESDILKSIQLFDVYSGDGVELGKKSIAVAFHLQHGERTMTDDEVDALILQITQKLQSDLGAMVRT
ncbi:phenylalanine--tRNA ligase subunit beta [Methylophaga sp.]|uniref:phenylalanine--tRNA ligase subunit beta n=1 Tax=Methylophaga sp. TaxID=2024840 RepID=UPI000C8CF9F7|nr:phenylalanine--tRNA ligase subunit beta [Methylophaga sp.]MAK65860.1 phenylalanine--tRNA ligase subunit beta [Methylophaga sp.]